MSNRFPGTGERIRQRLRILGYWNEHRDSPDVMRFCKERGYLPQYVYEWLKGTMPAYENLKRLSQDLEVPMAWILFGSDNGLTAPRRPAPVALPPSGTRRGRGWRRNAKGLIGMILIGAMAGTSLPVSADETAPIKGGNDNLLGVLTWRIMSRWGRKLAIFWPPARISVQMLHAASV